MNKINQLVATFENGDQLVLSLNRSKLIGYETANIFELTYSEKIEDSPDWQNKGSSGSYFNPTNTEYFPESCFGDALSAFNKRLTCSNPMNESDLGWDINKILFKEKS